MNKDDLDAALNILTAALILANLIMLVVAIMKW